VIAVWVLLVAATGVAGGSRVWAEDEVAPPQPAPVVVEKRTPTPIRKRRIEKEAEGTEALGRFEADTVIKSQYTQNGEPLEVDPD